eukprot:503784-Rhodomonas_salina.1
MPEPAWDRQPWKGPRLGHGATVQRRDQTGTSLAHQVNGRGVVLGERCGGTVTAGGPQERKRVGSRQATGP